jgi:hypothetical protein
MRTVVIGVVLSLSICLSLLKVAAGVDNAFCDQFTLSPSSSPTLGPTPAPSVTPTYGPTIKAKTPTAKPSTHRPTKSPTAKPSHSPTKLSFDSFITNCSSYTADSTDDNLGATICTFYTKTTGYVTASSCSQNGGSCTDDTYFSLYDESGNVVAVNDDRCGVCSAITFKPASSECSVYYLYQYCYPGSSCGGTTAITNGYVLENPTFSPTYTPSFPPTPVPTEQPTNPTAEPTVFMPNATFYDQLSVLYELYTSTGGADWSNSRNWGSIPEYIEGNFTDDGEMSRNLKGVKVVNGNVVSIKLPNNKLIGTIPDSIQYLTALQHLDLGYNYLTSSIPTTFSFLTNLLYFNFADNFLTGTVSNAILDKMTLLQTMTLRVNLFSGTLPFPQTREVNSLALQQLEIYENFFSGTISADYCDLTHIQVFLVASNDFSCYSICNPVTNGSVYDYLTTDEVPVCSGYQDEALCALQDAFDVNSHIPSVERLPQVLTVSDRFIEGHQVDDDNSGFSLIHDDVYTFFQSGLEKYEVTFDDTILRGDLRKYDNKYFTYNYVVRIGESQDGATYTYRFYCGYCDVGTTYTVSDTVGFVATGAHYPGTNGADIFETTLPYLTVNIYIMSQGSYALYLIPGYTFTVTNVYSSATSRWQCETDALYVSNPCDWFGKFIRPLVWFCFPFSFGMSVL